MIHLYSYSRCSKVLNVSENNIHSPPIARQNLAVHLATWLTKSPQRDWLSITRQGPPILSLQSHGRTHPYHRTNAFVFCVQDLPNSCWRYWTCFPSRWPSWLGWPLLPWGPTENTAWHRHGKFALQYSSCWPSPLPPSCPLLVPSAFWPLTQQFNNVHHGWHCPHLRTLGPHCP